MGLRISFSERNQRVVYAFSATALLLLLVAASPLMLKEDIEGKRLGLVSLMQSAEAASAYTLTVRSLDLSDNTFSGMYTVIRSSSGAILKTGFTPLTFTGQGGSTYTVAVSDYRQFTFDHWGDGSTNRARTITLSQDFTANAYYKTGTTPGDTSGGSTTDTFGVKMLYPTKTAGEQWFMNADTLMSDARFDGDNDDLGRNLDGSWKTTNGAVRLNVFTSSGYDDNDIDTYNQNTMASQGYMQDSKDWKNVEMTGYVKFNSASDDNLSWNGRGGKHYAEGCEGTAYKGRLFYYSGETGFAKEQWHSGGYAFSSGEDATSSIMDRWIGFKFVMYNTVQNGKTVVVLENWLNDEGDKTSSWKKVASTVDDGGWGDEGDYCGGSPDQIMTWGGPIATFRWDDASDVDFKWLSVREIKPPT